MTFKLFIFDLDGVLVNTCDMHYKCLNNAISEIAGEDFQINRADHDSIYNGLSTKSKLKLMKNINKELHSDIYQKKQELTHGEMSRLDKSDVLVSMMNKLKENNIKIMCASNCIRKTVEIALDRLGIINILDGFLSNEDVINSKPNPDIYLKCMDIMKCTPNETIIFEDSYVGLQAAMLSGAHVHYVKSPDILKESYVMNVDSNLTSNVNIVIPMAGNGSRFSEAGYKDPKPFIPVFGKPMISWVVKNLGVKANYTFVIRNEFKDNYNAVEYLNTIAPGCNIVTVDKTTEGAACTVLLTENYINNDHPLIIINSDQYIEFADCENASKFIFDFLYNPEQSSLSGKISTFDGKYHPKWSYAKTDEDGIITEVQEKNPISEHATTGLYMWRHGSDFVKYAKQMISKNVRVNNEFYVVPVFNEAINDGLKFSVEKCNKMWGIGVPEDLSVFLKEYPLKLAICYSGEARDIKYCIENHKEKLYQHHKVHVYMHTWKTDETDNKQVTPVELGHDFKWRKSDHPYLTNSEYLSVLNPYRYAIEVRNLEPASTFQRQVFMYHGINNALKLINSENNYDFVVRIRPDLYICDKVDFGIINDVNSIYLPINHPYIEGFTWEPPNPKISDFLGISSYETMLKYYSSFHTEYPIIHKDIKIQCLKTVVHLYRNMLTILPDEFLSDIQYLRRLLSIEIK